MKTFARSNKLILLLANVLQFACIRLNSFSHFRFLAFCFASFDVSTNACQGTLIHAWVRLCLWNSSVIVGNSLHSGVTSRSIRSKNKLNRHWVEIIEQRGLNSNSVLAIRKSAFLGFLVLWICYSNDRTFKGRFLNRLILLYRPQILWVTIQTAQWAVRVAIRDRRWFKLQSRLMYIRQLCILESWATASCYLGEYAWVQCIDAC